MDKELIQKRPFIERKAQILENKVTYESTYFGRKLGTSINYEDLLCSKSSHFQSKQMLLYVIGVSLLFTIVSLFYMDDKDFNPNFCLFWGVCLLISSIIYILTVEQLWKIKVNGNTFIFFLKKTPSAKEVNTFIEDLFHTRNTYLRETYYKNPSKLISYEAQKNNLLWLRRIEAITKEEYTSNVKDLDTLFVVEVNKVGF